MKEPEQEFWSAAALQDFVDRKMSEAVWQQEVISYAKEHDWMVVHFRPAQTSKGWRTPYQGDSGFPDTVFAKGGRLLFAELKRAGKRPTPEQQRWLDAGAGYFWTPRQRDEMHEVLEDV